MYVSFHGVKRRIIFFQLIADFVVYLGLLIRPRKAIAAENLFLRRQLALYQERKVDPR